MQLALFGGIIGMFAGFVLGHLTARMGRARTDLKVTKATIPKLKTLFWSLFRQAVGRWVLIAAIVGAVGYVAFFRPPA